LRKQLGRGLKRSGAHVPLVIVPCNFPFKKSTQFPYFFFVSKWFVSHEEWPGNVYPDFLSGWAYATGPLTAAALVQAAQKDPRPLWIDDLWVTGILASSIGAPLLSLNSMYTVHTDHLRCCLDQENEGNAEKLYQCDFLVGPSSGDKDLVRRFGQLATHCHQRRRQRPTSACERRPWKQAVSRTCVRVNNPLLLPDSPGVGEVIVLRNEWKLSDLT